MSRPLPTSDSPAMRRILSALAKNQNMAVSDLSAEAFVGVSTLSCGGYVKALKMKRLIHISGWRQLHGRFSTPLYSVGDFPDVQRPAVCDANRNAPGMWRILETLVAYGQLTYKEIAEYSGLSRNTIKNSGYLSALLAQKQIHISGWKRALAGPMLPIYRAGNGRSAAKPEALSSTEKSSRHRQRKMTSKAAQEIWQGLLPHRI